MDVICRKVVAKFVVPAYVGAQVLGSTLASGTLRLIFNGHEDHFAGTLPVGPHLQSLVLEFIITFYLMFVISGVATDNRAIGELAGLAVGATVLLNVMFAGYDISSLKQCRLIIILKLEKTLCNNLLLRICNKTCVTHVTC
ncbi:putative major intrinsic protein [Helianthus annuus]|nr:putative major intrinsic protein [Helianthus annuus]